MEVPLIWSVTADAREFLAAARLLTHEQPGDPSPAWNARKKAFYEVADSLRFSWEWDSDESLSRHPSAIAFAAMGSLNDAEAQILNWIDRRDRSGIREELDHRLVRVIEEALAALTLDDDRNKEFSRVAGVNNRSNENNGSDISDALQNNSRALPDDDGDKRWLGLLSDRWEDWHSRKVTMPAVARQFIGQNIKGESLIKKEIERLRQVAYRYRHAWHRIPQRQ